MVTRQEMAFMAGFLLVNQEMPTHTLTHTLTHTHVLNAAFFVKNTFEINYAFFFPSSYANSVS